MQDDIRALVDARGYGANATTANQLKALDEEYHELLDQGRSEKADYVQKLYAFKQKQQHSGSMNETLGNLTESGFLRYALMKYLDAVTVEPNTFTYHVHAGRLHLMFEENEKAIERLRCALSLKPTNIEAK